MSFQFPILDLPTEKPEWANNSSHIKEPGSMIVKTEGHALGKRTSAKELNWLANLQNQAIQRIGAAQVSNWMLAVRPTGEGSTDPIGESLLLGITYHPNINHGTWFAYSEDTIFASANLSYWWEACDLTAFSATNTHAQAFVITEDLIGLTVYKSSITQIVYSADGITWSILPITGFTGQPVSIVMSDEGNTTAGICCTHSTVRIVTALDDAGWIVPTTPPAPVASIMSGVWMGGEEYGLLAGTTPTVFWASSDGGDVWENRGSPFGTQDLSELPYMAYNYDTDRLIVGATTDTFCPIFAYSDDYGETWTTATLHDQNTYGSINDSIKWVYYCGGQIWIAGGDVTVVGRWSTYVSLDNGETWGRSAVFLTSEIRATYGCACDGRILVLVGDDGHVYKSLAANGGIINPNYTGGLPT